MITIVLNGEKKNVPDGMMLDGLLKWLNLPADRVAVERNRELVSREHWKSTPVSSGDHLEVVHFVGGGE